MNKSRRSVAAICEFSDKIHGESKFPSTLSEIGAKELPVHVAEHLGMFVVKKADFATYYDRYHLTILRHSQATEQEMCAGREEFNFGKSKGMTFDRTLILPTEKQRAFLKGDLRAFSGGSTDEAVNKFYVASTRARYSVKSR